MHLFKNRNAVTGLALSIAFFIAICPVAFAAPVQPEPAPAESDESAASVVEACLVQIDEIAAAEARAAIPDSVLRAQDCIGTPYRSGSSSPSGFDCSGLVSYALTGEYGHAYTSYAFWNMPAVADPQPGDVVACSPGHCGLYIGDGQMIHAPQSGETVRVEAIRGKIVRP